MGAYYQPRSIDALIGHRIRRHRKAQGMSLERLGERIGMSHVTLHRYEIATRPVPAGLLVDIAYELGTTVAELVGEAGAPVERHELVRAQA